jgi:hypothetical protein
MRGADHSVVRADIGNDISNEKPSLLLGAAAAGASGGEGKVASELRCDAARTGMILIVGEIQARRPVASTEAVEDIVYLH